MFSVIVNMNQNYFLTVNVFDILMIQWVVTDLSEYDH